MGHLATARTRRRSDRDASNSRFWCLVVRLCVFLFVGLVLMSVKDVHMLE